jgi:hypothetical protein
MKKSILIGCALLLVVEIAPLPAGAQPEVAGDPTGEGDPAAITCRAPQLIPGYRRRGPRVCKTNAVWAEYREDGMTVSADGTHDIPVTRGKNCQSSSAGSVGGQGATSSITCE